MSIDGFLDRKYNKNTYNCLHFTVDVWNFLTGDNLKEKLEGLLSESSKNKVTKKNRYAFKQLNIPESPCLVIFQRPNSIPHIGVYLDRKILHIQENGVLYAPINTILGFKTVRYFR